MKRNRSICCVASTKRDCPPRSPARRVAKRSACACCRRPPASIRCYARISTGCWPSHGISAVPTIRKSYSPRSTTRSAIDTTGSMKPRNASSSTSPYGNCAAAIPPAPFSASSVRRAPARRHWVQQSPTLSAASFIASRWVACATKPRSVGTVAPMWAPCPVCSYRLCAAWKCATRSS